jgi:hypothetical protein
MRCTAQGQRGPWHTQGCGGQGQAVARRRIECPDVGQKVQAAWMDGDGKDKSVNGRLVFEPGGRRSWAGIVDAPPGDDGGGWRRHRQDDAWDVHWRRHQRGASGHAPCFRGVRFSEKTIVKKRM